ncbi:MAG: 2-C-methyl-D-erythritol 4-phosphate cytidylyltransferase [Bacteroidales bacterium]|nr:2-C-methyl-D-erythritol 4-phosphate cytidylyltransferase [Bacteroidales bacterium]
MAQKYVIITAGGRGSRMGAAIPKQFLILNGLPVIMHSINAFLDHSADIKVIVALPQEYFNTWKTLCSEYDFKANHQLCAGGETRFQSVKNGLSLVDNEGIVAVHDAVRPLVSPALIKKCFIETSEKGNAVPVVHLKDSVREVNANDNKPIQRERLRLVQTPQVFMAGILKKAYQQENNIAFTDDASVAESQGVKINLIEGDDKNIKITTPDDLIIAEALMKEKT